MAVTGPSALDRPVEAARRRSECVVQFLQRRGDNADHHPRPRRSDHPYQLTVGCLIGSPLCQDTAAGTGVRSVVSPGSGLSEVLAVGIRSAALDVSVAPKCPSRTFVVWSLT